MFLLLGKVWTQLWNSLFSRQRWLSTISKLIWRTWRYYSFPRWCFACHSWSCCYRRSLTPVTNLLKDKRQLWKQLLVRPFDKEDISFHLITFIYRACSTPWRFRVNQPGVGSRTWCPQLAWGEIYLCLKKKKIYHLWHQFRVPNICSSLYLGHLFAGTKCWFVRSKKPGEIPELRHCTSTTGNTRHTKLATLSSLWQNFFTIFTTTIIRW